MPEQRRARLFRNGRNQAVRIPVEFELPGSEAIMHRDGDRLVIEPVRKRGLTALLKTMSRCKRNFPESMIPFPLRRRCFDTLHARHQYHLRPDPKSEGEKPRSGSHGSARTT